MVYTIILDSDTHVTHPHDISSIQGIDETADIYTSGRGYIEAQFKTSNGKVIAKRIVNTHKVDNLIDPLWSMRVLCKQLNATAVISSDPKMCVLKTPEGSIDLDITQDGLIRLLVRIVKPTIKGLRADSKTPREELNKAKLREVHRKTSKRMANDPNRIHDIFNHCGDARAAATVVIGCFRFFFTRWALWRMHNAAREHFRALF